MVELLIEGWCEPPAPQALRLSTLTHQILSVVAEHGGVSAKRLYATALALRANGYTAEIHDGFLNVNHEEDVQSVEAALEEIADLGPVSADSMLSGKEDLMTEKFHPCPSLDLLIEDATSSRIDLGALPELARSITGSGE